jgi:hypothetical protein
MNVVNQSWKSLETLREESRREKEREFRQQDIPYQWLLSSSFLSSPFHWLTFHPLLKDSIKEGREGHSFTSNNWNIPKRERETYQHRTNFTDKLDSHEKLFYFLSNSHSSSLFIRCRLLLLAKISHTEIWWHWQQEVNCRSILIKENWKQEKLSFGEKRATSSNTL